jgi:hypothetical protein
MALDCDQHAADKLFPMPVKNQPNILANVLGAHVIQAELDDAGKAARLWKSNLVKSRSCVRITAPFSVAQRMTSKSEALGGPSSRQWRTACPY